MRNWATLLMIMLVLGTACGRKRVVALDPVADERIRVTVPTQGAVVRHIAVDEKRRRVWLPLSEVGKIGLIELRPAR